MPFVGIISGTHDVVIQDGLLITDNKGCVLRIYAPKWWQIWRWLMWSCWIYWKEGGFVVISTPGKHRRVRVRAVGQCPKYVLGHSCRNVEGRPKEHPADELWRQINEETP